MFVTYMHCKAHEEGDREGFVIAIDDTQELNELDYILSGSESLWIVPGTYRE